MHWQDNHIVGHTAGLTCGPTHVHPHPKYRLRGGPQAVMHFLKRLGGCTGGGRGWQTGVGKIMVKAGWAATVLNFIEAQLD